MLGQSNRIEINQDSKYNKDYKVHIKIIYSIYRNYFHNMIGSFIQKLRLFFNSYVS